MLIIPAIKGNQQLWSNQGELKSYILPSGQAHNAYVFFLTNVYIFIEVYYAICRTKEGTTEDIRKEARNGYCSGCWEELILIELEEHDEVTLEGFLMNKYTALFIKLL